MKLKILKKISSYRDSNQSGFTIIELLIATAVFAVVLVVLSQSLLDITNTYYKGITESNTQNAARNVINTVTQAIQYNGGIPTAVQPTTDSPSSEGYCIGGQLVSYLAGYELEANPSSDSSLMQEPHAIVISTSNNCSSSTTAQDLTSTAALPSGNQELLSPNMRVGSFSITPVDTSVNLYKIDVKVIYGATDLISNGSCIGVSGSQFCAVSELSSIVQMRVK